jgi:hypothetical protein
MNITEVEPDSNNLEQGLTSGFQEQVDDSIK